MAFGLGGLVALSAAGKLPQAYQDYQERQAKLDEAQQDAMAMAALGNLNSIMGGQAGQSNYGGAPQTGAPPGTTGSTPPAPGTSGIQSQPLPPPWTPGRTPPPGSQPFTQPQPLPGPQSSPRDPQGNPMPSPGPQGGGPPQVGPIPNQFQQPWATPQMMAGAGQGSPPASRFMTSVQPPGGMAAASLPGTQAPPMSQPGMQPGMPASLGARGGQPPLPSPQAGAGGQQGDQTGRLSPQQQQYAQQTLGFVPNRPMGVQDLIQQLRQGNPGIPPQILGRALIKAIPLMNAQSQMQMQMSRLQYENERLQEQHRHNLETEKAAGIREQRLGGADPLTPAEIEAYYRGDLTLGNTTSPRGRAALGQIMEVHSDFSQSTALNKRAAETADARLQTTGLSRAAQSALMDQYKQQANLEGFEEMATKNGEALKELVKKVDNTGVPLLNKWVRATEAEITNNPDLAEFNGQLLMYRNEIAKIGTALKGVLTVSAQHEMEEILQSKKVTPESLTRLIDRFAKDAQNRHDAMEHRIQVLTDRFRGKEPAATPAPSSEGWTVKRLD